MGGVEEMKTANQDIKTTTLVITRTFDAPRELVWKAWTDAGMLKKWWGPKQFTCPVSKIDFRVDGKYLHCMRGPDGKDYWSTGVYKEIVALKKIVATDSFADENGTVVPATYYGMEGFPMELQVTLTFEEAGDGKTRMTLRHDGMPAGTDSEMASAGWNESLDKLAEALKSIKS